MVHSVHYTLHRVCPSVGQSVAPNSRMKDSSNPKIEMKIAYVTCNSRPSFGVNSLCEVHTVS